MTETSMNMIIEAAEELALEITAYRDYSGRGMYGKTTCAVVYSTMPNLMEVYSQAIENALEEGKKEELKQLRKDIKSLRTDNLGLSYIAY